MKYDELHMGDWVLYNDTPIQVQMITKRKIGYHTKSNESRLYYARLVDIKPITLTPEHLEQIGFYKSVKELRPIWVFYAQTYDTLTNLTRRLINIEVEFDDDMKLYQIRVCNKTNNKTCIHEENNSERCFYIHEFQHILCNCELKGLSNKIILNNNENISNR